MSSLKLPPVDQYRQPFIVPLGHLAMEAAFADNRLIALLSICAGGSDDPIGGDVPARLRNWGPDARKFAAEMVSLIADETHLAQAQDALARFDSLRAKRHRMVHDAIELGLYGGDDGRYEVVPLQVEYNKTGKRSSQQRLNPISPEEIAELACAYHELQKDLDALIWHLRTD